MLLCGSALLTVSASDDIANLDKKFGITGPQGNQRTRPSENPSANVRVVSSQMEELKVIYKKLSGLKCKDPNARWAQKRILQLIPHIYRGESINCSAQDMKGNTCLHYACELGSRQLIHWLVENGADVNRVENGNGNTPLHNAAKLASLHTVSYLLEHGANPNIRNHEGKLPLDVVGKDDHDAICTLLKVKGDSNTDSSANLPDNGVMSGTCSNAQIPSDNNKSQCDLAELKAIYTKLVGLQCKGAESRWAQKRILQLIPLILQGDSIDYSAPDMKGNTCLHYACELGSRQLIQWLVENGADVNRVEYGGGNTPLHNAARLASLHTVTYLLQHGAKADATNHAGQRPVDVVGRDDHEEICELLAEAMGDTDGNAEKVADKNTMTPEAVVSQQNKEGSSSSAFLQQQSAAEADAFPILVQEMMGILGKNAPEMLAKPLRVGVLPFKQAFVDAVTPLDSSIIEELEIALTSIEHVEVYSRSDLAELENEVDFHNAYAAPSDTECKKIQFKGVDVLIRGYYLLNGSKCTVYATMVRVSDAKILAKGKTFVESAVPVSAAVEKEVAVAPEVEKLYEEALRYYFGDEVSEDKTQAANLFRRAAEQGYAEAQFSLGNCYRQGEGVAKNWQEAVKWYRKAAEQGYANAQNNLGYCYTQGEGVAKDKLEAVKWFLKAAEQGSAPAQASLGVCYAQGEGVAKDMQEAVKWFLKAAEQGNANAQYNLGYCYLFGEGVTKDMQEAVKWFREAAEQGDAEATEALRQILSSSGSSQKHFHKRRR